MIIFTWDKNNSQINLKKHGVSFLEARTIFTDAFALIISDEDHSLNEERYILLGMSYKNNILVVVHCYRDNENEIHIISARKANNQETKEYINRRKLS